MKDVKILGLLALAAMAIIAFVGTASASAAKFTASKVGAPVTEETKVNYVFGITGSSVQCSEYGAEGKTESLETETAKFTPTFGGCTAFGFSATLNNNGCEITVHAGGEGKVLGSSCELTLTVNNFFAKCKGVVKAQNIPNAISYTDNKGHITVKINASGVAAEVTESSGLCPLTVGKHTTATLTGESTIKAEGATIGWDA